MKPFLIIVRAGRRSLHNCWIERGASRDFDLHICPFEETPWTGDAAEGVTLASVDADVKWRALHRLLREWQGWRAYAHVVIADDDVLMTQAEWDRFFAVIRARSPALAQPALTRDSFWSHPATLRNPNFLWRETTFVEGMAPCFRVDVLDRLIDTFALSRSGWGYGLEFIWAQRIGYKDILIVDACPMRHTRPVGASYPPGLMEELREEMRHLMQEQNAPWLIVSTAGRTLDGRLLPRLHADFLRLYFDGYWDLAGKDSQVLAILAQAQTGVRLTL